MRPPAASYFMLLHVIQCSFVKQKSILDALLTAVVLIKQWRIVGGGGGGGAQK